MITVTSTNKPPRVTATAYAYVTTDDHHTAEDIITVGLCALNETREMLYGFGIENDHLRFRNGTDYGPLAPGRYAVYAYRD